MADGKTEIKYHSSTTITNLNIVGTRTFVWSDETIHTKTIVKVIALSLRCCRGVGEYVFFFFFYYLEGKRINFGCSG